jgi:hypothetical protein
MEEIKNSPKLCGTVEVDETYIGGKYDERRKRGPYDKQPVMGLLERNGRFEAKTIPTNGRKILIGVINDRVSKDATIMTDEYAGYKAVSKEYKHETVNHSKGEYVRGNA